MSYIYPSSFAAEHCIFSAEKYSAVCLQDCYLCWGRPGSAEALAETWASAIKTPRSAEPTQNFFLEKPERYAFLIKKFKGTCSNLGNSRESSQNCPGFWVCQKICVSKLSENFLWTAWLTCSKCWKPVKVRGSAFTGFRHFDKIHHCSPEDLHT